MFSEPETKKTAKNEFDTSISSSQPPRERWNLHSWAFRLKPEMTIRSIFQLSCYPFAKPKFHFSWEIVLDMHSWVFRALKQKQVFVNKMI